MEDLSRFCISVMVVFLRLHRSKDIQGTAGELRIDQDVLKRGDQAVASEWGDEPGKAGCGEKRLAIRSLDWKPKRGHILQCATKQSVELLVARLNLGDRLQPVSQSLGVFGFFAVADTIARRIKLPAATLTRIHNAAVPGFPGFESDFEAEPAIGIRGLAGRSQRSNRHRPAEITVAVGCAKPLQRRQPFRDDAPAADNAIRFHLEDVRKVAAYRDLELKLDRLHAVVGDIKILVHAATDPAADAQPERAGGNRAALGRKVAIRQRDPCRIVGDGTAIEQLPWFAIGVDGPATDHARIEEIQTLFARPVDLPVQLAD